MKERVNIFIACLNENSDVEGNNTGLKKKNILVSINLLLSDKKVEGCL